MNVLDPSQPSDANSAITTKGNISAGDNPVPALPPLAEHAIDNAEVNEDIIVGGYHIDGVADVRGVDSQRHVIAFYKATIPLIKKSLIVKLAND